MNKLKLTIEDSSFAFFSGFILSIVGSLFFAIFNLIICTCLNIKSETFLSFIENNALGILLSVLVTNAMLVLTFLIFNKKKDNKIISKPKFSKLLIYIGLTIVAYLMLTPIINSITVLFAKLGMQPTTISYDLTPANYFISLISLVLLPAVCEELLFRGLIFKGLKPYGKTFSIVVSALMFSIFHMSIEQAVYPFVMGLLFGVIMYNENNILYCIAVHFISNFTTLTLSYFGISLFTNHWSYYLIAILLFIAFIAFIVMLIAKSKPIENKEPITKSNKVYLFGSMLFMIIIWLIVFFSSIIKI